MWETDEAISIGDMGRFATNTIAFMESPWKFVVLLAITFYISVVLEHAL